MADHVRLVDQLSVLEMWSVVSQLSSYCYWCAFGRQLPMDHEGSSPLEV